MTTALLTRIAEIDAELAYLDGETAPTQADLDLAQERMQLRLQIRDAEATKVHAIHCLGDRFHRELGRVIGTDHCPTFWARNFGCDITLASQTIDYLLASGRARLANGRLYAA